MTKKAVTLSLEDSVADQFQEYCHQHGLNMSRQVELFMERQLELAEKDRQRQR
jgi:hypothetical protein